MALDPYVSFLAVMTLRQFQREAARKQDVMRETQYFGATHTQREVQNKQLKEMEKDKNLLLVRLLKANDRCEKCFFCLHFCCCPYMTWIRSRPLLLRKGWWVSMQEFYQQLQKTLLLLENSNENLQRGVALWEPKSNYLQRVRNVLTPQASDAFFEFLIFTKICLSWPTDSISCQRDSCLFWRSSTVSVLQWLTALKTLRRRRRTE